MIEFGSDFHYMDDLPRSAYNIFGQREAVWYTCGRAALVQAALHNRWKRIWIPAYICHDLVQAVRHAGIEVMYYPDSPLDNDVAAIDRISFRPGDALLRVNYFGLRGRRESGRIPVEVIEDHTHDPAGGWACGSSADWCFASLRKSLPVADGGLLWSPRGRPLPRQPADGREVSRLAAIRLGAMKGKSAYVAGRGGGKDLFRGAFAETEKMFAHALSGAASQESVRLCKSIDTQAWFGRKEENWRYLNERLSQSATAILQPEQDARPFSLVMKFSGRSERDAARKELTTNNIYPAILWPVQGSPDHITILSERLLSLHCDARYSPRDMEVMAGRIEKSLSAIGYY